MFNKEKVEKQASEQLADIAIEFVKQNRSKRRWMRFLFLLIAIYLASLVYFTIDQTDLIDDVLQKEHPFVAEVVLQGEVSSNGDINTDDSVDLLEEAFSEDNAKAIILRLNSAGGSPVVAHQIYQAINRLKAHHQKKIYVVIEEICASACYLIAASADEIYADNSSIIGSIGVIISSFGLVEAIKKLGIERRLHAAGKYKGMLDPFSLENKAVNTHIQQEILDKSHQLFIDYVKKGRGKRLKTDTPDLFSGLVWLGEKSQDFGLIDGIGDSYFIANDIVGVKDRVLFEPKKTLLEELTQANSKSVFKQITTWFEKKLH